MMKELKVDSIDNYLYTLVDSYEKVYKLNIEVRGVEIKVGDTLILNDDLLREKMLTFEEGNKSSDAILISNNLIIHLRRVYG